MNLFVKQRAALLSLIVVTLVLAACGTEVTPLTDYARFEQAGMVTQAELDDAIAKDGLGMKPEKAIVPLYFGLDNNVLSAEEFNRFMSEDKLMSNVSEVTYTDFITYKKVMEEKARLGLSSQAKIDTIDLKYVSGLPGFAVKGVDVQTQLASNAINQSVAVFDPYQKSYYTAEEVERDIDQRLSEQASNPLPVIPSSLEDSYEPSVDLSVEQNTEPALSTQQALQCATNVYIGDLIINTDHFVSLLDMSKAGHSGFVSWTGTGRVGGGNGCDSKMYTIEAVGYRLFSSTSEVQERPASEAFSPRNLPNGKDIYYARYYPPRRSGESDAAYNQRYWDGKNALRDYHRAVDDRNDVDKVRYGLPVNGKDQTPDSFTKNTASSGDPVRIVYCSLLNWMAHKKVYGIDIDVNGGPYVLPLDLIQNGSLLDSYFKVDK